MCQCYARVPTLCACFYHPNMARTAGKLPEPSETMAGSLGLFGPWEKMKLHRKLFKSGNSIVVSLPRSLLRALDLERGCEVSLSLDEERGVIVVAPASVTLSDVDAEFVRQAAEFIEEYRPALEALASGRSDGS
jgi:antitoxin MazE